nr:alkyl sulfatase C-terminal domain-containing protein [Shimia sp. R9_3]
MSESACTPCNGCAGRDAIGIGSSNSGEDGENRWVAELVNHVVYADPDNEQDRSALDKLILQEAGFMWLATTGEIKFTGNPLAFRKLMGMMDDFDPWFNIVTP